MKKSKRAFAMILTLLLILSFSSNVFADNQELIRESESFESEAEEPTEEMEVEDNIGETRINTSGWILGDVNGDSAINNLDLILLAQYLVGSSNLASDERIRSDINGDGTLTNIDQILLARMIVNLVDVTLNSFCYINRTSHNSTPNRLNWKPYEENVLYITFYWEQAVSIWNGQVPDSVHKTSLSSYADVLVNVDSNATDPMGVQVLTNGGVEIHPLSMYDLIHNERVHSTSRALGICLGLGDNTYEDVMYGSISDVISPTWNDKVSFNASLLYYNHPRHTSVT